jgi:acyl-CoA synthetase (AMP-forming)/AMP-acid ligase II/1-acyl-sn-glycerol-3-phosphate acyltransferase/acyl carrier protein
MKEKLITAGLYVIFWLVRLLVALRYRLVIKGMDKLTPDQFKRSGGIIFLPNHPAEIDPIILEMVLWRKFRPKPLVVEHFYHLKGFRFFMDLVKAMPLPTMDVMANKWRGKKVEKQFNNVVSELKNKKNFLIYPSGRLKHTGMELIGGASFVHNLLQACPEANLVLIRTTGLWGSKFSRALTGASPDFGKVLWECTRILIKNGIFFAPKRNIVVEVELPLADFPFQSSRLEFNKYLENWYNRYPEKGPEPLKLVSYAFWKEELPKVYVPTVQSQRVEERPISKKIREEVFSHLASLCGRPVEKIERKMHLSHDLGLDSLDVANVYVFLDERYGISDLLPGDLHTVEDVLQAATGYKKERADEGPEVTKCKYIWPEEKKRLPLEFPSGKTIQEVFLRSTDRNRFYVACYDVLSGPLTYRQLKLAVLLLSDKFKKLPGKHIGIMLPSTTAAYLMILAVLFSGKVPVMINWTSGVKALDHAAELTHLKAVITSSRFLDRLENGDLGKIEEMLLFLEDIRESIGFKDRLRALALSMMFPKSLLKKLNLHDISSSDPAVILFTSGTETLPKGVPLSHCHLLSNQHACFEAIPLLPEDILLGVLPPFHSFGFSVTGLYPLLIGMRVCYSPDPNDSHGLAREIAEWKPTLFCCAPSFIKAVFRVSKPEQLRSLRIVVSGAEKTPQDLFDHAREHLPKMQLLEGYGITECSPVVTIDRLDEPHKGVGKPLPGVELMIIDPASLQPLSRGQEGEVCIAGPNVFNGYLGNPRNPFVTASGKRWYASGDRGFLSEEGHLILSGRLKRFVKIGGEMISLGGIEDELMRLARERHWVTGHEEGPALAVSVREKETDKPVIILYTTFTISKENINSALKESGMGRIVKISEVRTLDQIPLTGTGKTHYRLLDELDNN